MTTASDEWIQESLGRLESMEEERQQHEAALETATDPDRLRFHSQEVERLEVEIRNLYQSLEAVADGQEVPEQAAPAQPAYEQAQPAYEQPAQPAYEQPAQPAYEQPAQPAYEQPAYEQPAYEQPAQPAYQQPAQAPAFPPQPAQPAFGQPAQPAFGQPAQPAFGQPAQPAFGQPAQPAFGDSGMSSMTDYDDGFNKPKKSGAMWGAIIVGVLALGATGYYFMQGSADEPEQPQQQGPVKVIGGGDVPPDTQGPKAAKGADVDSNAGTVFKEGTRPSGGGGGGHSGGGSGKKKKKVDQVKITKTDDPLAGVD